MQRILRDVDRFSAPPPTSSWTGHAAAPPCSLLLVGAGDGGAGATALAAYAAYLASANGSAALVHLVTALDLLLEGGGNGGEGARVAALAEKFAEAGEMETSLFVLDDVDQLCARTGADGYSNVMLATLRALLRTPPGAAPTRGGIRQGGSAAGPRTMPVIGTTSCSDAACIILHELFEETVVVPQLSTAEHVEQVILATSPSEIPSCDAKSMAVAITKKLGTVGVKTVLRLVERASAMTGTVDQDGKEFLSGKDSTESFNQDQLRALQEILDDMAGDEVMAAQMCKVF
mmetsp:Transcript_42451/g.99665  ORF Transcript_42451/g.99665 Transcript_42451/m.99665 type:complete len:289 (-) Transcript_42451:107-973(-)